MGNNLSVSITADVVDLQTKFGVAKAETQALSAEFNNLAKQSAAGSLDAAGQARFQQLASDLLAARTQAAGYARELRDAGFAATGFGTAAVAAAEGAEKMGLNTASAIRYTRELFDEISSGRTRYLPSTLAALAQQGLGLSPAMLGAAAGVAALTAALGYLAYKASQATDALNQAHLDALRSGADESRAEIEKLGDQLAELPSVSSKSANEIVDDLVKIRLPLPAFQAAARVAAETMVQGGMSAKEASETVTKALKEETSAVQVAKSMQGILTQEQVDAAEAADKSGNANAILAEKLTLLSTQLSKGRVAVQEYGRSWGQAFRDVFVEMGAGEAQIDPVTALAKDQSKAWHDNAEGVEQYTSALRNLPVEKTLNFKSQSSDYGRDQALEAAQEAADLKQRISEQEIEQANQALNQIAAAQERATEEALAAAENAANVKHQIAEREIQDADRMLNRMVADQRRADEARLQSERRVVRGIESAEDTMITGLLSGRQSFAQVAEQTAIRLAQKEIEAAAHAVTERLILQRSGAAAEKAVSAQLGVKTVMQDAGKAAAGAYSAVAAIPYVGPFLAPAAAATAYAGVMAFEGLASLDVGTNYVPRDMVAQIHEGEAVVPKQYNPAAGGEAAAGGFSESHHYHGDTNIRAIDTQDMTRAFKRNRSGLVAAGVRAYRRGAIR